MTVPFDRAPVSELGDGARTGHTSCPVCARAFRCGGGAPGCWCEAIALQPETLAELRTLADACLCPGCLGQLAQRDRVGAANPHPRPGTGAAPDLSALLTTVGIA
jgi:hypothetical protein